MDANGEYEREEGEIVDDFEYIISSDEEDKMRKRIRELEERNEELERIAKISANIGFKVPEQSPVVLSSSESEFNKSLPKEKGDYGGKYTKKKREGRSHRRRRRRRRLASLKLEEAQRARESKRKVEKSKVARMKRSKYRKGSRKEISESSIVSLDEYSMRRRSRGARRRRASPSNDRKDHDLSDRGHRSAERWRKYGRPHSPRSGYHFRQRRRRLRNLSTDSCTCHDSSLSLDERGRCRRHVSHHSRSASDSRSSTYRLDKNDLRFALNRDVPKVDDAERPCSSKNVRRYSDDRSKTTSHDHSEASLEEKELRLIALKSAYVKKHLKRKEREAQVAYSPTDFDMMDSNMENATTNNNDAIMDISPLMSPNYVPSPCSTPLSISSSSCATEAGRTVDTKLVDMELATSDNDSIIEVTDMCLDSIPLPNPYFNENMEVDKEKENESPSFILDPAPPPPPPYMRPIDLPQDLDDNAVDHSFTPDCEENSNEEEIEALRSLLLTYHKNKKTNRNPPLIAQEAPNPSNGVGSESILKDAVRRLNSHTKPLEQKNSENHCSDNNTQHSLERPIPRRIKVKSDKELFGQELSETIKQDLEDEQRQVSQAGLEAPENLLDFGGGPYWKQSSMRTCENGAEKVSEICGEAPMEIVEDSLEMQYNTIIEKEKALIDKVNRTIAQSLLNAEDQDNSEAPAEPIVSQQLPPHSPKTISSSPCVSIPQKTANGQELEQKEVCDKAKDSEKTSRSEESSKDKLPSAKGQASIVDKNEKDSNQLRKRALSNSSSLTVEGKKLKAAESKSPTPIPPRYAKDLAIVTTPLKEPSVVSSANTERIISPVRAPASFPQSRIVKPNKVINSRDSFKTNAFSGVSMRHDPVPPLAKKPPNIGTSIARPSPNAEPSNKVTTRLLTSEELPKYKVSEVKISIRNGETDNTDATDASSSSSSEDQNGLFEANSYYDNESPLSLPMESASNTPKRVASPICGQQGSESKESSSIPLGDRVDNYLKSIRSKFDSMDANKTATSSLPNTSKPKPKTIETLHSPVTPSAVRLLPNAAQEEYRILVRRMQMLERQKLSKKSSSVSSSSHVTGQASASSSSSLVRQVLVKNAENSTCNNDKAKPKAKLTPPQSKPPSIQTPTFEKIDTEYQEVTGNLMFNIEKNIRLVRMAKRCKINKLRCRKRIEELQDELRQLTEKESAEQTKMRKLQTAICTHNSKIAEQKDRLKQLQRQAGDFLLASDRRDQRLTDPRVDERREKLTQLAYEIKNVNNIKMKDIDEIVEAEESTKLTGTVEDQAGGGESRLKPEMPKEAEETPQSKSPLPEPPTQASEASGHNSQQGSSSSTSGSNSGSDETDENDENSCEILKIYEEPPPQQIPPNSRGTQADLEDDRDHPPKTLETLHEVQRKSDEVQDTDSKKGPDEAKEIVDGRKVLSEINLGQSQSPLEPYSSVLGTDDGDATSMTIDPLSTICPFQIHGECIDEECKFMHFIDKTVG